MLFSLSYLLRYLIYTLFKFYIICKSRYDRCCIILIPNSIKIMILAWNGICVVVLLGRVISILGQWQVPLISREQWNKLSRIFLFIRMILYLINWYSQTLDVIGLFADSIILQSFIMTIYAPKIYDDTLICVDNKRI